MEVEGGKSARAALVPCLALSRKTAWLCPGEVCDGACVRPGCRIRFQCGDQDLTVKVPCKVQRVRAAQCLLALAGHLDLAAGAGSVPAFRACAAKGWH